MTGLVVRDRASVVRGHAEDRLLEAGEPRVTRGEPVLVRKELTPLVVRDDERLVDDGLEIDRSPADGVRDHEVDRDLRVMRLEAQVVLEDVLTAFSIGLVDHELTVETAGSNERRVENVGPVGRADNEHEDRKSTRLNSSHLVISYAVFCLKKKKKKTRAAAETAER